MSIKTSSIYTSGNDVYFYSDRVKVFPCAYRGLANPTEDDKDIIINPTARLNTEYNFTHLPHMVDKASYIIKFDNEKLICVINGYYFEIELGTNDSGISDYSILYNKNKYLNICVASPSSSNGENFIEGPHLCSWNSSNIEAGLDLIQATSSSSVYVFTGLQISEPTKENPSGNLSREGYQCYALKLDASAKLPISASKIENSAGTGKPISQEFATDTLTANTSISTTSLNTKSLIVKNITGSTILEAHPSGITANIAVNVKSNLTSTSLDVINGSTQILKAWNEKVNIHKPTYIKGAGSNLIVDGTGKFGGKLTVTAGGTDITGDTQIKKSSSGATDGNLIVSDGSLTVAKDLIINPTYASNGLEKRAAFTIGKVQQQNSKQQDLGKLLCADVEVPLFVKNNLYVRGRNIDIGNTSSVPNITIYGIQPKSNDTSTFVNGELLKIDQVTGKIAVYGLKDNEAEQEADKVGEIFSINPKTGETFANKINATVEGTSDKAINAQNVTDTIKGTNITDIFGSTSNKIDRLKLRIIEPDTDATWDPDVDQSVKIILKKDTDPVKTKAVSFFLAKGDTAAVVKADEFIGVAEKAQAFNFPATISLSGDVDGKAESTYGWTIKTTINDNAVTKTKIKDGEVTNDKLAGGITNDKLVYNSITIGSTEVGLGGGVGDHESRRIAGTLYGTSLNLSGDMLVSNIGNIKVNNAGLKSSSLVKVDSSTVKLCDSALVVASNSVKLFDSVLVVARDSVKIGSKLTITPSNGNIVSKGTVEAASFNAASDRRLKENIIDYKPEKSILDLPIKKFDFIDGPKNQIGCIAQDLKEICPEIVNENEKGYLSIQENKLVYLLLDEVKKLKNEVEKLKNM